jgi:hypothetical protein
MFATQFSVVEQFFATFQQSRQFLNKVSLTVNKIFIRMLRTDAKS